MKELLQKFYDYLLTEKCVATNTLQAYQRDIGQFMNFLQRSTAVASFQDLQSAHVKDFLKHARQNLLVGAKSSSRKLSALKTLANYLFRYHDIPTFTQGVLFPQIPKQLPKHITQEQIKELIITAGKDTSFLGQRNKLMICLLYACGMRVSELVSLKISQIHISEHCLKVFGKGGKERFIPLPDELIVLLQQYIEQIHGLLLESRTGSVRRSSKRYSDYLFPVLHDGKINHITRQAFWRILKGIARESGLMHGISPHVLRHSLATHLLKGGANLRVLQTLLGHEKINTVQVYTHIELSYLRELYDKYHPRA